MMLPYYILIFTPIIIALLLKLRGKKYDKICIGVFFAILLIILSLRNVSCGIDLKNYYYYFNTIHLSSFHNIISNFELGNELLFKILNKVVYKLNNNFNFYLFVVAVISLVPIFLLYVKESKNSILTLLVFIGVFPLSMYFSGLRQVMAIAIVAYSYKYIKEKKFSKFAILVLLASLFHESAIFTIVLYPLYHCRITKKWLWLIVPSIILVILFKNQIFSYLINFTTSRYQERYAEMQSTGAYGYLMLLFGLDILSFIIPDSNKLDKETMGLRNFLLFATYLQCFASINSMIMRLNYYILIFIPILIPKIFALAPEKNKEIINLLSYCIGVFFLTYFIYNAYFGSDILNIFPYIPYWR